ncbi:MAG: U32 family peptidase [Deltaproteobacteria bacterium]|nr:U32 family peptidase [Deltaproteobacteria bacterium]MDQ3298544.1 U32 family peptidase [Myxococcota bacterium]
MKRRPEILAPAGDRDALAAALAAGADAVYFGLDDGFNARARAANFSSESLAEIVAWVHRAGARAYVTLNTLVFEPELAVVEELLGRVAAAGTDAIIVQDPAVALLARAISGGTGGLEVHGSTQMTASGPLAAGLLAELGLTRIVVPRELSVDEIRAYAETSPIPLEVFIHGALCVAWSGQCLSSEAWGGRSANRGQCAQACRLPYQLVVDDRTRELGEVEYLLSPKDLVGTDAVAALADIGVASLKIEGRLKGPQYVATTVAHYRAAAAAAVGEPSLVPAVEVPADEASLHVAYSRGISRGFLGGADHQTLVEGRFPRHRGLPLGRVTLVDRDSVVVVDDPRQRPNTGAAAVPQATRAPSETTVMASPPLVPRAGMGIVFDRGRPEDHEQGGPIFGVEPTRDGYRLSFGRPGPDLTAVRTGDFVWVTSDPRVTRAGEKAAEAGREALERIRIDVSVRGAVGMPLEAIATRVDDRPGARPISVSAATRSPLAAARGAGLTPEVLADKLGSFGGTAFHFGTLDVAGLATGLHVPVSELKEVRRALVAQLDAAVVRVDRVVASTSQIDEVRAAHAVAASMARPSLVALCRTDAQLDAVLDAGADEVELDWMELVGLGRAVERARARGVRVGVATVRVQKPGEDKIDAHLARLAPDHVLVRSWGSLAYFQALAATQPDAPALHGDFSLNVTNSITAGWVLGRGLATVTAAHDLDREQLLALLAAVPRGRIGVTIHHHIPTFHTEHCVYAHLLSSGRDYRTCGRPCEQHQVALRDRVGLVHPVVVDVGCRNTVFNAQAQSAASLVPDLLARGVARFRIELVRETASETTRLYAAYRDLIAGTIAPAEVVRRAEVHEQFGVTRGTMRTLTVLR